MGKIKQGILGDFSGKVGTVIGGTWKGIGYMRGIAPNVSNPQTEAQLAQRQKFAVMMGFLQTLTEFLKTGFKTYAVKMTCFNAAMGYNIRNAITGAYPEFAIDYPNALVSRGSLPAALNATVTSPTVGSVVFEWDDNSSEAGASAADEALLVVYNPAKRQAVTSVGLATRAAGTQSVDVPVSFAGDTVHCYVGFASLDGKDVASSRYAGSVVVFD